MPMPTVTSRLIKPIIVATALLCLCLAGLIFIGASADSNLTSLMRNRLLLPALLLQLCASLLFILAWKTILGLYPAIRISFTECSAHIGITLLGKYLPGKIWGLLGRSYLLGKRGVSARDAMALLLADQFATFYTGIMIGLIALTGFYSALLALALTILLALTMPAILQHYDGIMSFAARRLSNLFRKISLQEAQHLHAINNRQFVRAIVVYLAHWLITAAVLCLIFYPQLADEPMAGMLLITAAIPLAVLLGFLAVWAPGGIGVREGAIVSILLLQLPLDLALAVALCYRLICILVDLTMGIFAVIYLLKIDPALLTTEAE